MKRFLSVLVVLAFVLGVSTAMASDTPTTNPDTSKPVATSTKPTIEKTAEQKAKAVCTKKGLTGTQLDECIDNEMAKLSTEEAEVNE